jgi:hypothetical protein
MLQRARCGLAQTSHRSNNTEATTQNAGHSREEAFRRGWSEVWLVVLQLLVAVAGGWCWLL